MAFWIAAAGIQFINIVEKRMLCNEYAANLRDGNCWEVLMSSFVYDLCWSKALHGQRSPDLSQTESICGRFGESVACFAQADVRTVENEVLHAIADSERCLGAWYGVIFILLAVVMNDP